MKLKYALTQEDFLTYQLFAASKKPSVKAARDRSRFVVPLIMFAFALFAFFSGATLYLVLTYLGIGLLWILFHPKYSARNYRRHYAKHVAETHVGRIGISSTLALEADQLVVNSPVGETKINLDQVKKIETIATHFFITLQIGDTFVLPRNRALEEGEASAFIERLAEEKGLSVVDRSEWIWK